MHQRKEILIIKPQLTMTTEELSNRLIQILTGITSGEPNPNIIQGFVQNFIEDFNIYLEREYFEY